MGLKKDSSVLKTSVGLLRISEFLRYMYLMIIVQIIIGLILIVGSHNQGISEILEMIFSSMVFIAIICIFDAILLFWLFWGFLYMAQGRKEINKDHEIRVMIASAFLVPTMILFAMQIILSKGLIISSYAFYFVDAESSLANILVQNQLLFVISIVLPILLAFSILFYIYELLSGIDKKPLFYRLGFLIVSPLTFNITALYAYLKFNKIYHLLHKKLLMANLKPTERAPCPFCNQEIPIDSKICQYCNAKFEKHEETEIDPRLCLELPKEKLMTPKAYSFMKGPSDKQKNKLKIIIIGVIAIIVVIAVFSIII